MRMTGLHHTHMAGAKVHSCVDHCKVLIDQPVRRQPLVQALSDFSRWQKGKEVSELPFDSNVLVEIRRAKVTAQPRCHHGRRYPMARNIDAMKRQPVLARGKHANQIATDMPTWLQQKRNP